MFKCKVTWKVLSKGTLNDDLYGLSILNRTRKHNKNSLITFNQHSNLIIKYLVIYVLKLWLLLRYILTFGTPNWVILLLKIYKQPLDLWIFFLNMMLWIFVTHVKWQIAWTPLWQAWNICRPTSWINISLEGFKYYIIFIDAFTKFTWIFYLKLKFDALSTFVSFKINVKLQLNYKIRAFHIDMSSEYQAFILYLKQSGITFSLSCSYTHKQNGILERKHRHIS